MMIIIKIIHNGCKQISSLTLSDSNSYEKSDGS